MRKLAWLCGGFCGAIFLAHYALPPKVLLVFSMLAAVLSVGAGMTGKEQLRRAVLCCFGAALGFSWYALSLRQIAPLADIPGTVPPPDQWPAGCAFAPRCAHADERCHAEMPPSTTLGAVRYACFH